MNAFKVITSLFVVAVASVSAQSGCHRPGYPVPCTSQCKQIGTYCCGPTGALNTSGTYLCK